MKANAAAVAFHRPTGADEQVWENLARYLTFGEDEQATRLRASVVPRALPGGEDTALFWGGGGCGERRYRGCPARWGHGEVAGPGGSV
ncbi:hypothetical protein [Corynebacterium heidelbergense]|uniref:hypothetical protein n=1 Tax=Corynebacterium heidelbergense TaxID=2055947 RepID=UPI0010577CDD|nr:hypothetical protein [Corynebacterium heidelbergense]